MKRNTKSWHTNSENVIIVKKPKPPKRANKQSTSGGPTNDENKKPK